MPENARFEVRIGANHLSAEGPPELVRAQWEQFMRTVSFEQTPSPQSTELHLALPIEVVEKLSLQPPTLSVCIPNFQVPGESPTSQRANWLLATIYLTLALKGGSDISASDLIVAMRKRGLGVDEERIDRMFDAHGGLVTKSGAKRGSRYGLTRAGFEQAESILTSGLLKKLEPKKE